MLSRILYQQLNHPERLNEIGIQMLPASIHSSLFPNTSNQHNCSPDKLQIIRNHLEREGLWGKQTSRLPHPDIRLPRLLGPDLEQHFNQMANYSFGEYIQLAVEFCRQHLADSKPTKWTKQPGWTRYTRVDGEVMIREERVPYPLENALTFDVEVLAKHTKYPILAVAASTKAWYCWQSPALYATNSNSDIDYKHLIPLGGTNEKKIIIGHHVAYDRARVKEEYDLTAQSKLRFLDTMSLHAAVAGLSSTQRLQWLKMDKELKNNVSNENSGLDSSVSFDKSELEWFNVCALNSLQSVAKLHLGESEQLDKSKRETFIRGTLQDVKNDLQDLIDYCATDVKVTHKVYQKVFQKFHGRKTAGSPVPQAGVMEMSTAYLPVCEKEWLGYIDRCERMVGERQLAVQQHLKQLSNDYLSAPRELTDCDHFMRQLDWQPVKMLSKKITLPKWYRQLLSTETEDPLITIRSRITPLLLRMHWQGFPLYYLGTIGGWCYRVPRDETNKNHTNQIDVEYFETQVAKLKAKSKLFKSAEERYLTLLRQDESSATFYRLPTTTSNNTSNEVSNCGSPFAKSFLKYFNSGQLTAESPIAQQALESNISCSYWISSRSRIIDQFVHVTDNPNRNPNSSETDTSDTSVTSVILPPVVPMGTITRRAVEPTWLTASNAKLNKIGSELKTLIKAPNGYAIVGADVDSQELWISSLLGDSQFGVHGATAFGWMALQGTKAEGTDLHSRSARILHSTRDHAKVFNYARIYGSGLRFAAELLRKYDPLIGQQEAEERASQLYQQTKGQRFYVGHNSPMSALPVTTTTSSGSTARSNRNKSSFWFGGSESVMFNALEAIATSADPRTPVLGVQLPESLLPASTRKKYLTSCVNWVVQSSGVDYLHLLLVSMRYLMDRYAINGRLLLTIHDEIRFLVKREDRYRAALALQISNLWTRSYFAYKCGFNDLPLSVGFFSAVDVDHVLRKEVNDDCKTPSFPGGVQLNGESLSIYELLQKCSHLNDNTPYDDATLSQNTLNQDTPKDNSSNDSNLLWLRVQTAGDKMEVQQLLEDATLPSRHIKGYYD